MKLQKYKYIEESCIKLKNLNIEDIYIKFRKF